MPDPYNLARFIVAQAPVYDTVLAELGAGRKRSHWMWFVFPQLAGLGHSDMAVRYALSGMDEARAYLADTVLGARLFECCALVAACTGRDIDTLFAPPDDLKFHSCLTLFARAAPQHRIFDRCLQRYFGGAPDPATLALLAGDV